MEIRSIQEVSQVSDNIIEGYAVVFKAISPTLKGDTTHSLEQILTYTEELRREMSEHPYYGYKVFLNWLGDQYPPLIFDEMLTENEVIYLKSGDLTQERFEEFRIIFRFVPDLNVDLSLVFFPQCLQRGDIVFLRFLRHEHHWHHHQKNHPFFHKPVHFFKSACKDTTKK